MNTLALTRHTRLTERVKSERKITHEILRDILVMEKEKDFAELGYSNMYDYLVRAQKYSEGSAQRRLSAARLLREVPEVHSKIVEGKINLTQLVKMSIAVKQEQKVTGQKVSNISKKEVLKKLEDKTGLETDKVLSQELHYTPKAQEKVSAHKDDYYLTLKLTQGQYDKLKKAQSLLSHSVHDGNFAAIIETLCDKVIQKTETAEKMKKTNQPSFTAAVAGTDEDANRNSGKSQETQTVLTSPTARSLRSYIPSAMKKRIFHQAGHCCEYISPLTGQRCGTQYQLQIDHKIPLAKGGSNHPENLRILCRTHNLSEARRLGLIRPS